ncbi:hypothetical protein RSOLAG22IIIB_05956 [Rhizoctonia solani]|uniref:BZIP domain-containing protein n=1 Tax=Rhizoctonia solani TaxID=456999 RepID=A0A0K6GAC2_9AGAM|nr:hypothetical protein RSOLAG22IIIB_05956 [Rhizoctonia solani]
MRTTRSSSADMVSQSPRSKDKKATPPPRSNPESRPLSRNAQAQARLRARRRAYVESLEAEIKRLQSIVDATALHPGRNATNSSSRLGAYSSPAPACSSSSEPGSSSRSLDTMQLRNDNERLRRERDAFRVQVEALMNYVSRGCELPPSFLAPSLRGDSSPDYKYSGVVSYGAEQRHSPTPDSEMGSEDPQDPFSQSPSTQPDAYTKDDTSQLFSFYESNLAFLRHFDLQAQAPALPSIGDKPIQLPVLPGSNSFGAP